MRACGAFDERWFRKNSAFSWSFQWAKSDLQGRNRLASSSLIYGIDYCSPELTLTMEWWSCPFIGISLFSFNNGMKRHYPSQKVASLSENIDFHRDWHGIWEPSQQVSNLVLFGNRSSQSSLKILNCARVWWSYWSDSMKNERKRKFIA